MFTKNKIIIYRTSIIKFLLSFSSSFFMTLLVVLFLCIPPMTKDIKDLILGIIILILLILFDILIVLNAFNVYICIDFKNNILTIKETLRSKKYIVTLNYLNSITLVKGINGNNNLFSIDLNISGNIRRIKNWIDDRYSDKGYRRQSNRLKKICEKANIELIKRKGKK